PVYDVASILLGRSSSVHRFYLIARRNFPGGPEASAIPVIGECELVTAELQEASDSSRACFSGHLLIASGPCISGHLLIGDESIEVLNFDALLTSDPAVHNAPRRGEAQP